MPGPLAKVFGCGRDRIYRILSELIEAGYVRKYQERDPVTNKWLAVEYMVLPIRDAGARRLAGAADRCQASRCQARHRTEPHGVRYSASGKAAS